MPLVRADGVPVLLVSARRARPSFLTSSLSFDQPSPPIRGPCPLALRVRSRCNISLCARCPFGRAHALDVGSRLYCESFRLWVCCCCHSPLCLSQSPSSDLPAALSRSRALVGTGSAVMNRCACCSDSLVVAPHPSCRRAHSSGLANRMYESSVRCLLNSFNCRARWRRNFFRRPVVGLQPPLGVAASRMPGSSGCHSVDVELQSASCYYDVATPPGALARALGAGAIGESWILP